MVGGGVVGAGVAAGAVVAGAVGGGEVSGALPPIHPLQLRSRRTKTMPATRIYGSFFL